MNETAMLKQAIGAMLMTGAIEFEAYSWCFGFVDMKVRTKIFTDEEFVMSVKEDDWNDGPAASVAHGRRDYVSTGAGTALVSGLKRGYIKDREKATSAEVAFCVLVGRRRIL